MPDHEALRREATRVLGPDEPVVGAFVCRTPRRAPVGCLAGFLPVAGLHVIADVIMSPFARRRQRAVVVTPSGIAVLGGFDSRGLPTTVVERLPSHARISEPDWTTGDVSITVGAMVLWVEGASIDEARRLARTESA